MACTCAPTVAAPSPELLAISKHASDLCQGITKVSTVPSFALSLEQESLITPDAKSSIIRTTGISDLDKCTRLLDAVREQVRIDRVKFEAFVGIFRREPALSFYAEVMTTTCGELTLCRKGGGRMTSSHTYVTISGHESIKYIVLNKTV